MTSEEELIKHLEEAMEKIAPVIHKGMKMDAMGLQWYYYTCQAQNQINLAKRRLEKQIKKRDKENDKA